MTRLVLRVSVHCLPFVRAFARTLFLHPLPLHPDQEEEATVVFRSSSEALQDLLLTYHRIFLSIPTHVTLASEIAQPTTISRRDLEDTAPRLRIIPLRVFLSLLYLVLVPVVPLRLHLLQPHLGLPAPVVLSGPVIFGGRPVILSGPALEALRILCL